MTNVKLHRWFGGNVRRLRMEKGWSQEELGDKLSLTRASISNIELGRQTVTLETFVTLSRCLRVSLDELVAR